MESNLITNNGIGAIDGLSRESQDLARTHVLVDDGDSLNLIYKGKGLRFPCICLQTFETCPALIRHLQTCEKTGSHKNIGQYRCTKCMSGLDSMLKIAGHFRNCKGPKETGSCMDTAAGDSQNGRAANNGELKCRFCERLFTSATGRGLHERRAHYSQFAEAAKLDKVPRWTEAEDALLVEAESTILLKHELTSDRAGFDPELGEKVYEYMREQLPNFRRSLGSVQQRRSKTDKESYISNVRSRMTEILSSKSGEDNSRVQDAEDSIEPPPTPVVAESSPAWAGCTERDCGGRLDTAINKHLHKLNESEDSKSLDIGSFLHSIKLELDAYDPHVFNLTMRRSKTSQNNRGAKHWEDTASKPLYAGKRFQQKLSQCAKVRSVFDKQGCKRCLQYLRNPTNSGLCSGETVEMFKNMFENNSGLCSQNDDAKYRQIEARQDSHLVHEPITSSEVKVQLRRLNKSTAPGPDGVRVADLQDVDPDDLACLFNIFLLCKNLPRGLKVNKTTMIPKSSDPGVSDWRPITIGSIIDRLFSKILEARLSSVIQLDPRQRGFMRGLDGCGENITAYGGVLKYARTHAKPLVAVSVDLAKAFDSVHHSTIRRALARLSVDTDSIELLMNLCNGQTTDIKYADGVAKVELRKGVRQGWPLSPLLFLSVVDELLCELKSENGFKVKGASLETAYLTGLAFADDVILYSSDECGIRRNLQLAAEWCAARDLKINPNKSTVLYLAREPKAKRVLLKPLSIDLDGTTIPVVSESFERVLGVHIHHTGKVDHKVDMFSKDLDLVCSSKLRPSQKVEMIRNCLVPMIKFRLVYGLANQGACNQVDRIVRKAVRNVLHLPQYYANSTMHATLEQGGLGVPCLGEAVPIAQAMLVTRMTNSTNEVTRLLVCDKVQSRIFAKHSVLANPREVTYATMGEISRQISLKRLEKFKGTVQGKGFSLFQKAPRSFIDRPRSRKWTDKDAIDALKMRNNLLWTRELAARTVARKTGMDVSCRACLQPGMIETQSHILSKCPSTRAVRTGRHDHVCAYLANRLSKSLCSKGLSTAEVHREFRVMLKPGEAGYSGRARELRPDIAVILDNRIVIIEVSVVYEVDKTGGDNSLRQIRSDKLAKYKPLKNILATRFGREVDINTLIVGCRGGWIASNNKVFLGTGLTLSEEDKNCLVERAVRGSLISYRRFLAQTFKTTVSSDMR